MNAEVVSVSSRYPTEPYYRYDTYLKSLQRFDVTPTILGMDKPWQGLMTKPILLREWLRAGRNVSERIIVCDAWDVVFARHPHDVGGKCAELFGDAVVFNGEKGCWPRADLADRFPDDGNPWRFLNSGFMCGTAERILAILDMMDFEKIGVDRRNEDDTAWIHPNDQGEYQQLFSWQPVRMVVDTACNVAQTLSACTIEEFDLSGEQIQNRQTGTYPGVWHFNGGSKSDGIMDAMLAKWGI